MEMNLIETINKFPDQDSCINYLERLRWQEEPTCPYCGSKRSSKRPGTHRHQCHGCNSSYSVLVGTIFEDTNLPLPKWFLAISLILNAKKGLSARQLARDLGINRKTGWHLQMRIRKAMHEDQDKDLFNGIVENRRNLPGRCNAQSFKEKA